MEHIPDLILHLKSKGIFVKASDGLLRVVGNTPALSDKEKEKIKQLKAPILAFLQEHSPAADVQGGIPLVAPAPDYPLSAAQRRLWILSQFSESSIAYNIPGIYTFSGEMNIGALRQALQQVIQRHEILRTVFRENGKEEVRQCVLPLEALPFRMEVFELVNDPHQQEEIDRHVRRVTATAFDLSAGPLLRTTLLKIEENKWMLVYAMHHIISDGWSMQVLLRELLWLYCMGCGQSIAPLPPLRLQYKDYTCWRNSQLKGPLLDYHRRYWLRQFDGDIPVLELPADKLRPAVKTYNGLTLTRVIPVALAERLKSYVLQQGATLFMGLLSLMNALFYRYTGQEDITIGTPVAGRDHVDLETQIGFYVNTLALRCRFSGKDSFRTLLQQVKQITTEAYEHQIYPFDMLVDELRLQRDMSHSPLFDVMITMQDTAETSAGKKGGGELTATALAEGARSNSQFDLSVDFADTPEGLLVILEYNTDLYHYDRVARLGAHMEQLLEAALHLPDQPLSVLDFLSRQEKQYLLETLNNTDTLPDDTVFPACFEEQVALYPDNIAVVAGAVTLTYRELNEKANQLARYLRQSCNVRPDELVAVCLDRNEQMLIAVLAILKAGAAYMPVDPLFPQERKDYMMQDSGCRVLIDTESLDCFNEQRDLYAVSNLPAVATPAHLAYVIYTSGSTGKPKGAMIEHKGLFNHLVAMKEELQLQADSKIAQTAPFTFDISVWQLLNPLICGGATVIYEHARIADPGDFIHQCISDEITILQLVPSYLKVMLDILEEHPGILFPRLRYLLVTGEDTEAVLLQRWFALFPAIPVVNAYGPAEAADDVTLAIMHKAPVSGKVPVGRPIRNIRIYLLDKDGMLCPPGIEGEICVSGTGVGRAYLNNEALTAARFTTDPFRPGNIRMYKTGDMGKWGTDGNLFFSGRRDGQVKIRGHRIETGEVENRLLQAPGVTDGVIAVKRNANGEQQLVAYVMAGPAVGIAGIRQYLSQYLPAYMLPAHVVFLAALPLTANGKIDRKHLPDPGDYAVARPETDLPANEMEEKLLILWKDVLGVAAIGMNDDFFLLGGNSISLVKLNIRYNRVLGRNEPLTVLYSYTTIRMLADYFSTESGTPYAPAEPLYSLPASSGTYDISFNQQSYFQDFAIPGDPVQCNYTVCGLDVAAFRKALQLLVQRHEILRTVLVKTEGRIQQRILPVTENEVPVTLKQIVKEDMAAMITAEKQEDFCLFGEPLIRVTILAMPEQEYHVMITLDHIIADGVSIGILKDDLLQYYQYCCGDSTIDVTPLKCQYRDFAVWQQHFVASPAGRCQENYWLARLENFMPAVSFAALAEQGALLNTTAVAGAITGDCYQEVVQFVRTHQLTMSGLMLGTLMLLVRQYSGQQDITVQTQLSGRYAVEYGDMDVSRTIGLFSNQIMIRGITDGSLEVLGWLKKFQLHFLEDMANGSYPFVKLLERLPVNPLQLVNADLLYNYQDYDYLKDMPLPEETTVKYLQLDKEQNRIALSVIEAGKGLLLQFLTDRQYFSPERSVALFTHYKQLLHAVIQCPHMITDDLPMVADISN
ncbi:amino acid adenylation domain-containing protein [Chitinophaga eiseniae]|uniref:Amino acid adenylation domain-containing protein n=1 Tax=Chitinophaga eiseniae TaxID=634771 RepID=A0A1T4U6K7_9BACT|nr:non-ribosomal peptide synthetase [Chitinophaga eiseniae]SKA48313.1 amino acid adenylation domain-containing protein [Chitinophaga eiseniae]